MTWIVIAFILFLLFVIIGTFIQGFSGLITEIRQAGLKYCALLVVVTIVYTFASVELLDRFDASEMQDTWWGVVVGLVGALALSGSMVWIVGIFQDKEKYKKAYEELYEESHKDS